jgi:hypothetical protein
MHHDSDVDVWNALDIYSALYMQSALDTGSDSA